jgi:hypothetical protein
VLIDTTSEPLVCVSLHAENARQIDAAAYALADLVATLRGME